MNSEILVVSRSDDVHADAVTDELRRRGVNFLRLDTDEELPREMTFSLSNTSEVNLMYHGGQEVQSLSKIRSVWFRRPVPPKSVTDPKTDPEIAVFVGKETKEWTKSLYYLLENSFWVNHPQNLERANRKIVQLAKAKSLGLLIPDTIISDVPSQVKSFYDSHDGEIVAKTLRTQYVPGNKGEDVLFRTQDVSYGDLSSPGFFSCPCIVQEKIERAFEVRVVAIGRKLFAFKISSANAGTDLRSARLEELEHASYQLSSNLKEKVCDLLSEFNLAFSSMDFLVTKSGREVFLELNPNGQWLWLEYATGVPLVNNFCDLLMRGKY